jgi:DNA-binding response OmpR family regulator
MENWKVLLVDDEEDFVSTLAERMALRGVKTRTALNGEQALRAVAADPPHIVVLDVMMPGMSGIEVLKRIKADFPNLPVILLTGIGSAKDGVDGIRLGAFDYLMKPLQLEELIRKISEAIKQASSGSE